MVAIAENARIPVDNPATHLELTMVHEAMVLEYSGRHLALIDLSAELKLLLYVSLIACLFVPWGIAPHGAGLAGAARRRRSLCRQARRRRLPAGRVRDLDRQDARVPRARIHGRGADARPARHAAAVRFAELLDARSHLRHRASARGLARAGELHAALPGSAIRAAQRLCAACGRARGCRWRGRPMRRTRRISTSPRRSRSSSRPSSSPSPCIA